MGRRLSKPGHRRLDARAQFAELLQLILADLLAHALQAAQHRQLGNRLRRDAARKGCFRQRDEANNAA